MVATSSITSTVGPLDIARRDTYRIPYTMWDPRTRATGSWQRHWDSEARSASSTAAARAAVADHGEAILAVVARVHEARFFRVTKGFLGLLFGDLAGKTPVNEKSSRVVKHEAGLSRSLARGDRHAARALGKPEGFSRVQHFWK